MSIQRTFYCDGPDCERHVETPREIPPVFLTVTQFEDAQLHFCGWDCVLRFAATKEPEIVIPGSLASD
jgi:hypothetical protein